MDEFLADHIKEGFWKGYGEAEFLPMPVANKQPWQGQDIFLKALCQLEDKLTKAYENRDPNSYSHINAYRGWSTCRICDIHNGSREFDYNGYVWPQGFRHYIKDHNVKPTDGFIQMILAVK
jgi:hypothetical protein